MKNLKRVLLVSLFMALVVTASAQLKFGVKAGFNASTIMGYGDAFQAVLESEGVNVGDFSTSYKPGFHVGLAAQFMFAPSMGIETGLLYSSLGTKAKYEYSVSGNSIEATSTASTSYLQLPIAYIYKFNVGTGLTMYPSAGIYFGYGLGKGKVKDEYTIKIDGDTESDSEEYDFFGKGDNKNGNDANRFDMGLTIGLNLEISNFTIGLGYDYGLMKMNKEDIQLENKKLDDMKNGNIKVSVGYFF